MPIALLTKGRKNEYFGLIPILKGRSLSFLMLRKLIAIRFVLLACMVLVLQDRVSLLNLGCPGTCSVDQAGP